MKQEIMIQLSKQQVEALREGDTLTIVISSKKRQDDEEEAVAQPREKGGSFFTFFQMQTERLRGIGKVRTSETYRAALNKLKAFRKDKDLSPTQINGAMMEDLQAFLRSQNLSMNSISFYLRILRAVYHRAVEQGLTINRDPFRRVYTGHDKTEKRALSTDEIRRILHISLSDARERFARDLFLFSFYTRGMAFVDMAYLKKKDLHDGILTYKRHKTGQKLSIRWEPVMQEIVNRYASGNKYMLPIIHRAASGSATSTAMCRVA